MNNKMITIPYADAIEYGENTSALFKALWELTDLIRLESDLKKHHRAYLHVREVIDEKVKEARQIMTKVSVDMIGFYFKILSLIHIYFAVKQYRKYELAAGKTAKSILISCGARLAPFDIAELRELMSYDEMELDTIGDRKMCIRDSLSPCSSAVTGSAALLAAYRFLNCSLLPFILPP